MYKRPPSVGTRVTFCPNPASRRLYSGKLPPEGTSGTVTTMPGMSGAGRFLPGPGGGLLYVKWDDFGTIGVSLYDVYPAKKAPCREGAPFVALEHASSSGAVKILIEEDVGRGDRPHVVEVEVEADDFDDAVTIHFADEHEEWIEEESPRENDDTEEFLEWLWKAHRIRVQEVD